MTNYDIFWYCYLILPILYVIIHITIDVIKIGSHYPKYVERWHSDKNNCFYENTIFELKTLDEFIKHEVTICRGAEKFPLYYDWICLAIFVAIPGINILVFTFYLVSAIEWD